jgi:hypothetical protein
MIYPVIKSMTIGLSIISKEKDFAQQIINAIIRSKITTADVTAIIRQLRE